MTECRFRFVTAKALPLRFEMVTALLLPFEMGKGSMYRIAKGKGLRFPFVTGKVSMFQFAKGKGLLFPFVTGKELLSRCRTDLAYPRRRTRRKPTPSPQGEPQQSNRY